MIPALQPYTAHYRSGKPSRSVVAWDDDGVALVVTETGGKLVRAFELDARGHQHRRRSQRSH